MSHRSRISRTRSRFSNEEFVSEADQPVHEITGYEFLINNDKIHSALFRWWTKAKARCRRATLKTLVAIVMEVTQISLKCYFIGSIFIVFDLYGSASDDDIMGVH